MRDFHHIVITGASQGIGAATALAFAKAYGGAQAGDHGEAGVRLSLLARNTKALEEVAAACRAHGAEPQVIHCDVSVEASVHRAARECVKRSGAVTAIVNNAGVFEPGGLAGTAPDQLQRQFDVNVMSAFNVCRELVPAMREAGRGHLFFMASIASFKGYPAGLAYGVTKHAMLGLARSLREELKPDGIRVTTLMPGATFTPTWDGADIPEERMMPAEDIAAAVVSAYALSPRTVVEEIVLRPQLGDL